MDNKHHISSVITPDEFLKWLAACDGWLRIFLSIAAALK
jgi:hypothetical protein